MFLQISPFINILKQPRALLGLEHYVTETAPPQLCSVRDMCGLLYVHILHKHSQDNASCKY